MSLEQRLQQRVRASKFADDDDEVEDDFDDEHSQDESGAGKALPDGESDSNQDDHAGNEDEIQQRQSEMQAEDENDADDGSDAPDEDLDFAEISFGALASAQASLGSSLKRKRPQNDTTSSRKRLSRSPSPFHEAEERRAGKKLSKPIQRSSKHAPTEVSSKKAVSRKRAVIDAPTKPQARDPRFSGLSGDLDENVTKGNYAFLDEYRASEMSELRAKVKKEKDEGRKEGLKKQLRAMEDRDRARQKVDEERRVVREHRKEERDPIKQGKKPYFLKQSDIKKQVLQKRFEGLSERKAERVMERKRKKIASKERKNMPDARRMES